MENDLRHEERGDLGHLFRSVISAERPSTNSVDNDLAKKEAQELYDVNQNKLIKKLLQIYSFLSFF